MKTLKRELKMLPSFYLFLMYGPIEPNDSNIMVARD